MDIKQINERDIIKWFKKGATDELSGGSSICSDKEIENTAYSLGAKLVVDGKINNKTQLTDDAVYWLIANHDFEKYLK